MTDIPNTPKCGRCNNPIGTGMMAVFCPYTECPMMPEEGLPPWLEEWRERVRKERAG